MENIWIVYILVIVNAATEQNKIQRLFILCYSNLTAIQLSGEININLKIKGFPTPVTSAFSMPNPRKSDGFDYFVFSWRKWQHFILQQ